jgi:hypothetical protein
MSPKTEHYYTRLKVIFRNWCTYVPLSFSSFTIDVCPGLASDTSTRPEHTSASTARPTPNACVIVDKITPTGPVASHPATYRPAKSVWAFHLSSTSLSSKPLSEFWTYMSVSPIIHLFTLNFTELAKHSSAGTANRQERSNGPSIPLLEQQTGTVKWARHYIITTVHMYGPVHQTLHYSGTSIRFHQGSRKKKTVDTWKWGAGKGGQYKIGFV